MVACLSLEEGMETESEVSRDEALSVVSKAVQIMAAAMAEEKRKMLIEWASKMDPKWLSSLVFPLLHIPCTP